MYHWVGPVFIEKVFIEKVFFFPLKYRLNKLSAFYLANLTFYYRFILLDDDGV